MSEKHTNSYTSSFKVKDDTKFKQWVGAINSTDGSYPCDLIEVDSKEHGSLYKLEFDAFSCGEIPEYRYDEEEEMDIEFDIYEEIQPHLADGWSVVFVNDESGYARVVTPTEIEDVSLYDAVRVKLEQLGNPLCPTIEESA